MINRNIRCFEIKYNANEDVDDWLINRNIRCFEMMLLLKTPYLI